MCSILKASAVLLFQAPSSFNVSKVGKNRSFSQKNSLLKHLVFYDLCPPHFEKNMNIFKDRLLLLINKIRTWESKDSGKR
jgi:hypothetical protein